MKPIKFLPIVMIAAAGLVASCATSKLAQTKPADDVYNSVAKAREVETAPQPQNRQGQQYQAQGQEEYDEYYGTSNPYYDMDYSSRINRFYNGYSFQGYYDPYFDNYYYGSSYGNSNYLGYGLGGWSNGYGLGAWGGNFGYGYGSIWSNPFYYGNFGYGYNNPYGWNSWGPNSYYDRYGWGGGGYYGGGWGIGGGYYGGGVYTNRGYNRPRPGSDDRGTPRYGNGNAGNVGRPSRSGVTNPNGVGYAPNINAGRPSRNQGNGSYAQPQGSQAGRPTRNDNYSPQGTQSSRPTRNETYTPPTRTESRPSYSPPPSNGGGNSGGGSTGGGGGGSRPSRAGRG
ncbi:hypothetical protein J7E50_12920 [Pedobacter sp. ISL-68]|uniref:hypothetical protein n=1 Tax=unclassified Pedobacter TaxID=2628915 RepID=UPI001BEC9BC2|nr:MULTISPECIES: hypothetical protein [unclassified Pedobacter]MBT2561737.1 hypothetical protein [Pedobacter sp. ISL-64]MBT2591125.1 hypothetical protein [Pedobacter sp. ISL-68]